MLTRHRNQFRHILSVSLLAALAVLLLLACGQSQPSTGQTIPQSEREVTYPGVQGVNLVGTLVIPAHRPGQRVPGVIIVAGSGPTDRNGNDPQVGLVTDLYQQIADQLAQQGIASLRYDKRGVGASTPIPHVQNPNVPTPQELAAVQHFAAWGHYVDDALATFTYLQQQSEIDPARTGLLGHSEGTYIVEQVASGQFAHPPAALVLISAPGRPYDVLAREQVAHLLQRDQTSAETTAFVLAKYDTIVTGIKATGHTPLDALAEVEVNPQVPTDIKQLMAGLFTPYNELFWQGAYKVNPVALVKQYAGPVLVLQGALDTQVFATEDTPLLDAALKSRQADDHETVIIPNASHNLKMVQDPTTDLGFSGPMAPEAANTLRAWLARKLQPATRYLSIFSSAFINM